MKINKVDSEISVSPQIAATDIADIARAGYKTIICNRPDGEGNDQPLFHEIEEAAQKAGAATPLGAEATQLYTLFNALGHEDTDFSGIVNFLRGDRKAN